MSELRILPSHHKQVVVTEILLIYSCACALGGPS